MHGSATKLQTTRTIGISGGATGTATSFNGTSNITIPVTALDPDKLSKAVPVSQGGTGNTTGNAPTATKLQTARNIKLTGAVSGNANFDGSGNIQIPTSATVSKTTKTLTSGGISVTATFRRQLNIVTAHFSVSAPVGGGLINGGTDFIPEQYRPTEAISKTGIGNLVGPVSSTNNAMGIRTSVAVVIRTNGAIVFNCVNEDENNPLTMNVCCTYIVD